MKKASHYKYFFICLCLLISSCSGLRHLPKGEKLYTGGQIKFTSTEKLSRKQKAFAKITAGQALRRRVGKGNFTPSLSQNRT